MGDRGPDAVVVGSGPNGLAAAVTLATAGRSVVVYEAAPSPGGGTRTLELTLPGYRHDVCSAIHPLVLASPLMRTLPLAAHGLEMVHPDSPFAHPLDDGSAVVVERSVDETATALGEDAAAWRRLFASAVRHADALAADLLASPLRLPRHPWATAAFGRGAIRSASGLARGRFRGPRARAALAGVAAHSMLRLDEPLSGGVGMMLTMLAHAVGWPMARGGSQAIAEALTAHLRSLGGEVVCDHPVTSVEDLPAARAYLFDVTPRQLVGIAGGRLPDGYRNRLMRYRYGPGVFKVDWALSGPVPWKAPEVSRAATVHLGGTLEEIEASEADVVGGRVPPRPYVLFVQQTPFDPSRAPPGKHTAWAYCHVPHGSDVDMTEAIEAQVDRFAPGFRDLVEARHTMSAPQLEAYNPNYVGGDINGGVQDVRQHIFRPVARPVPYATPNRSIYLCSSSTPPGGGVHGMCGYHAARAALRRAF